MHCSICHISCFDEPLFQNNPTGEDKPDWRCQRHLDRVVDDDTVNLCNPYRERRETNSMRRTIRSKMKPILHIEIELTPEQVKKMEGATKVLTRMSDKKKPGSFLAQIEYTGMEFNAVNRAMNCTPRMKCYIIPSYLMKRLIRTVQRASNPANKIPRRQYWKAAATGILKYIKNSEVKRRPRPHINEENSQKPYGGRFENMPEEDDIPF